MHGLTVIALLGSVFSPYYARARRRGQVDPLAHCALNVAFYGPGASKHWAMTERGRGDLKRAPDFLAIGPSALTRTDDGLHITFDETTVPLPRKLRGEIRVRAETWHTAQYAIDNDGHHLWQPLAPCATVEVYLEQPALSWRGGAYLDSNRGDEPLESGFTRWHWSRAHLGDGRCAVLYETLTRAGNRHLLALELSRDGSAVAFTPPPAAALPATTVWRIGRTSRSETGRARVQRTLEDTPFYARSVLTAQLRGEPVHAVHESLDLRRFERRWVQALLPFRMPRRAR